MTGQRTLRVTVTIDDGRGRQNDYTLVPLDTDPGVAAAAWRFVKRGMVDGSEVLETYDVRLDEHGLGCECLGWLRWGKCKHSAAVAKLLGRNILGQKGKCTPAPEGVGV
jgi:hypothetical protein